MLFLLRPRQTWMPYRRPRGQTQQDLYNEQLRAGLRFDPTGCAYAEPVLCSRRDPRRGSEGARALHRSGVLTDVEFAAAKAKVLAPEDHPA